DGPTLQVRRDQRLEAVGVRVVAARLPVLDGTRTRPRERRELPLAEPGAPAEQEQAPAEVHRRKLLRITRHRRRLVREGRALTSPLTPGGSYIRKNRGVN